MNNSLKNDERGSVAIITSVMALTLLTLIAFSLDMMIITKTKSRMQAALDSAVLSALNAETARKGGSRRPDFHNAFNAHTDDLSFIDGEIKRSLSLERGEGFIKADARASALLSLPFGSLFNQRVRVNVESDAEFVTPKLELALVLDISSSMTGTKIAELQNAASVVTDTVLDGNDDAVMSIIPFGGNVRLPQKFISQLDDMPVNRAASWFTSTWNQCFLYDVNDLQNGFGPTDTHAHTPDFTIFGPRNSACPLAGNEAVFATRDRARVQDLITNLTLSDGTSTDIGAAWGYNALSETWRNSLPGAEGGFPERDGRTTKAMVVMSDGEIIDHYLPSDIEVQGRIGDPNLGNATAKLYRTDRQIPGFDADENFQSLCEKARNEGIIIYSIAFDVDSPDARQSLENCAGRADRYFEADPGQLLIIFETILDNVISLRLTG